MLDNYNIYIDDDQEYYKKILNDLKEITSPNSFWFIHKSDGGPHIRFRINNQLNNNSSLLNYLTSNDIKFYKTIYEEDFFLFGGKESTREIYNIFSCVTNTYINDLNYYSYTQRIQKAIKLSIYLANSVSQDYFETWDVFCKLYELRKLKSSPTSKFINNSINNYISIINNHFDEEKTIIQLKDSIDKLLLLNQKGQITRGVRSIISTVIIFIWNIYGLSPKIQSGSSYILKTIYHPDNQYINLLEEYNDK